MHDLGLETSRSAVTRQIQVPLTIWYIPVLYFNRPAHCGYLVDVQESAADWSR